MRRSARHFYLGCTNVDGRHGERGGRRKGESTYSEHRVKESVALSWSVEAYKEFRLTVGGMELFFESLLGYAGINYFDENPMIMMCMI